MPGLVRRFATRRWRGLAWGGGWDWVFEAWAWLGGGRCGLDGGGGQFGGWRDFWNAGRMFCGKRETGKDMREAVGECLR